MRKATIDHMARLIRVDLMENGRKETLKFCRVLAQHALQGFVDEASLKDWDELESRKP